MIIFLEVCRDQVTVTVGLAHHCHGLLIEISKPLCVDPLPATRANPFEDNQGPTCSCLTVCRDVLLAICEDLANFSIIQGRGSEFGNNGLAAVGNLPES